VTFGATSAGVSGLRGVAAFMCLPQFDLCCWYYSALSARLAFALCVFVARIAVHAREPRHNLVFVEPEQFARFEVRDALWRLAMCLWSRCLGLV